MSKPHEYSEVPIERLLPAWRAQVAKLSLEANELHAENLRLKAEIERLKAETIKQIETAMPPIENYIAQLEANVEQLEQKLKNEKSANANVEGRLHGVLRETRRKVDRLEKAGDAMAEELGHEGAAALSSHQKLAQAWHAAKEGKQS